MISHTLQFIFIHIPKTSGNSLSLFLKDCVSNQVIQRDSPLGKNQGIHIICEKNGRDIKHEDINYYYKLYSDRVTNYYKFAIVRNPYDRIMSFYFWKKGKDSNTEFDYNEFVKFVKQQSSYQYKYITNKKTQKIDCEIIHYENLIPELKQISTFQGKYDFDDYPTLNASANSKIDYHIYYNKYTDLQGIVYKKFKKDFEFFDYKK